MLFITKTHLSSNSRGLRRWFGVLLIVATPAVINCGSEERRRWSNDDETSAGTSSGTGPSGFTSGVDTTKPVNTLSGNELAKICDWYAGLVGGYAQKECPDGTTLLTTSGSQEFCISNALNNNSNCSQTVGSYELCAIQYSKAASTCDSTEDPFGSAACQKYFENIGQCSIIN